MAVTSIYGVDILQDNVDECRKRLFEIWDEEYTANCKKECREECREAVRFILERNILCGNALTLKHVDLVGDDTDAPIIFSEWVFTGESSVKRSDYRLDVLMNDNVLVYKSADISDADLLIRISNSAFYDDFIRYGQCQAYGQSREEMEKSVKVFPKIIAYAQDKPVGVISY